MFSLENLTMQQLNDIYFKEYGYEPSETKSREELLSDLRWYKPVSLRDNDFMN